MICTEYPFKNNKKLIRTYSDDTAKILRQNETGSEYEEAIDVYPVRFTYTEVDKPEQEHGS